MFLWCSPDSDSGRDFREYPMTDKVKIGIHVAMYRTPVRSVGVYAGERVIVASVVGVAGAVSNGGDPPGGLS